MPDPSKPSPVEGTLLVISGPSGSGKSTICRRLMEHARVEFSVSATTRSPRASEVNGRDYIFIDQARFRAMIEEGAFIEWAEVHGNLYGTPRRQMEDSIAAGRIFLVEIDVQGGAQLKALGLVGVYVFVEPPDAETLRKRLEGRGTDTPEVIDRRLLKAREEMLARDRYDHHVINDDLEQAIGEVRRIVGLGGETA